MPTLLASGLQKRAEPVFVNLLGSQESIPSLAAVAGRYENPICRTSSPGYGLSSLCIGSVPLELAYNLKIRRGNQRNLSNHATRHQTFKPTLFGSNLQRPLFRPWSTSTSRETVPTPIWRYAKYVENWEKKQKNKEMKKVEQRTIHLGQQIQVARHFFTEIVVLQLLDVPLEHSAPRCQPSHATGRQKLD